MARITVHTLESAPKAARPRVEAALKSNGFLPNLIGVLANSPQALAFYQEAGKLNAQTSLSAAEREVVQITAAVLNRLWLLRSRAYQAHHAAKAAACRGHRGPAPYPGPG